MRHNKEKNICRSGGEMGTCGKITLEVLHVDVTVSKVVSGPLLKITFWQHKNAANYEDGACSMAPHSGV